MSAKIDKIINLIEKTGDKCVILEPESDKSYVIMTFADYEKLISCQSGVKGLTEDELLDKINHDIAVWKSDQQVAEEKTIIDDFIFETGKNNGLTGNLEEEEEKYYFESVE